MRDDTSHDDYPTHTTQEACLETQDDRQPDLQTRTHPADVAHEHRATWPEPTGLCETHPALADIYRQVLDTGLPNALQRRVTIPSGLNIPQWISRATGHCDDKLVLDGVQYGFSIQYMGPPTPTHDQLCNHASAAAYPTQVSEYLQKETDLEAIIGPFTDPPFKWCHASPLMSREKSADNQTERRIIVDLSFPHGHDINSHIQKNVVNGNYYNHALPTVDHLVNLVAQREYIGYAFAVDIARAYRNFRSDPLDWPLLGVAHGGHTYIDLAMPFGARLSSLYMQRVAQFISRHLATKGICVLIYLDDVVGVAQTYEKACKDFNVLQSVLSDLGLPLARHKMTPPTRVIQWLGIILNMDDKTLKIPHKKVGQIRTEMAEMYQRSCLTRRQVQSIAGKINHLAKACRPARLFMARILAYLRGHPPCPTMISKGTRADLRWFLQYLPTFNGISTIPHPHHVMVVEADSCMKGGGAHNSESCYYYTYDPEEVEDRHISQLEAVNVMAAVRAFVGHQHKGNTVMVHCDNQSAVAVYTAGRGRDEVILACARALWRHAADMDANLIFKHVPGQNMTTADILSRAPLSDKAQEAARVLIRTTGLKWIPPEKAWFSYELFL